MEALRIVVNHTETERQKKNTEVIRVAALVDAEMAAFSEHLDSVIWLLRRPLEYVDYMEEFGGETAANLSIFDTVVKPLKTEKQAFLNQVYFKNARNYDVMMGFCLAEKVRHQLTAVHTAKIEPYNEDDHYYPEGWKPGDPEMEVKPYQEAFETRAEQEVALAGVRQYILRGVLPSDGYFPGLFLDAPGAWYTHEE